MFSPLTEEGVTQTNADVVGNMQSFNVTLVVQAGQTAARAQFPITPIKQGVCLVSASDEHGGTFHANGQVMNRDTVSITVTANTAVAADIPVDVGVAVMPTDWF